MLGIDIPIEMKKAETVEEINVKLGKQQTLFEKIRDGIKKQNDAFDISKEITGEITKSVGWFLNLLLSPLFLVKN